MFTFKTGNILTENVEAIVNTVNCVGIMGRGIALQFKKAFPENFKAYESACKLKEVQPGRMFIFETLSISNPRYIVNFPTKRHWRGKSRIEDIESGLLTLADEIRTRGIRSIAIPPLGAGLGGLEWSEVRKLIEATFGEMEDVQVVVFKPLKKNTDPRIDRSKEIPPMTPGRAALVALIDRYLKGLLDPFVTLIELHKLMYFMQIAGEPLRLQYRKYIYGPYAENLRHVLNAIEGHLISGYKDGGDRPDKQLSLIPGALGDAQKFLKDKTATLSRLNKVSELVDGFESPFGLELLATVHYVAQNEPHATIDEITSQVHSWNKRKKQFSQRQIQLAYNVLIKKGWLETLRTS